MTVHNEISKAFNKYAPLYEQAAKVQLEIGSRLIERLHYLKINPKRILDLGCGPGTFSPVLRQLFPKAHIVGLDLAQGMLHEAKKKQGWRRKWSLVAADMVSMPFASGTFDLIFANQVVHWGRSLPTVFSELNRIMSLNACLMFTSLGPDTFKELRTSWLGANEFAHVNEFADMHDVGDYLLSEHFLDPVMDMEHLTVQYKTVPQLLSALKNQGVKNIHAQRNKGLTGKASWKQFEKNYEALQTEQGKYPLTYEVVYGHAWKGATRSVGEGTETFIPLSHIRKK